MAVIARCPHCDTSFRVTPKQMKAKSGKVRCGSCKAVFNVLEHLVEDSADPATPRLALQWPEDLNRALGETAAAAGDDAGSQSAGSAAAGEAARQDADASPPATPTIPAATAELTAAAVAPPAGEAGGTANAAGDWPAPSGPSAHARDDESSAFTVRELRAAPGYNRWAEAPLSSSGGLSISPPATAMSPAARVMWPVLGAVALVALVFHAAYHWRTDLAARLPAARPFLDALCVQFHCTIELPREAAAVTIDTSTLQTDPARPGVVLLDAILRNSAPYAQALPNLELTLTDAADRPLVRRSLAPGEYLSGSEGEIRDRLAAGFPANSELGVRIWLDVSELGAAGYRLYLFYP